MHLGDPLDGVGVEGPRGKILEQRAWDGGREVEVKIIVKRAGGIGNDPLNIGRGGLEEIDGRDVMDGLAVLVDEEVKGNPMFAQILDVDQRG